MAQYAVPDADLVDGNWLDEGGGNTDLYDGIVPGTPGSIGVGDDATYIESPSAPSSQVCAFSLSAVTDPAVSSGHVMRWRRQKNAAGGAQIDLTVEQRQGYVNESTQGTLLRSVSDTDLSDTVATTNSTLSAAQADAITDYSDLAVRFIADQP